MFFVWNNYGFFIVTYKDNHILAQFFLFFYNKIAHSLAIQRLQNCVFSRIKCITNMICISFHKFFLFWLLVGTNTLCVFSIHYIVEMHVYSCRIGWLHRILRWQKWCQLCNTKLINFRRITYLSLTTIDVKKCAKWHVFCKFDFCLL